MSSGPWQTLGSGFNLLCKRREKIYIWLERTARCVCLCTKTCWDDLVIRNLSVSEGCGAFAEHHWHRLGKHRWVLLRNPDSQRGSQHSGATAACSSPPGGQSSEGRSLLQHLRRAQPTTTHHVQTASVPARPSFRLLSDSGYTSSKYLLNYVLYSNSMLLFLHQRKSESWRACPFCRIRLKMSRSWEETEH